MNRKGQRTFGLGNLVIGFVVIIIGIMLYPMLVEQLDIAASASNNVTNIPVSESANTILGLIPLFFVLGILMFAVKLIMSGLGDVGILGGSSDGKSKDEEEDEEDEEDEEEDESDKCEYCNREIIQRDSYSCDECEEEICVNCRHVYGGKDLCEKCYILIDPNKKEIKKVIEPKKEEVKPIITKEKTIFEKKSKFDKKTKYD